MADDMDEEYYDKDEDSEEVELDGYDMLTKVTDTTAAQARRGKDIQGIPWERLNITREKYRQTRIEQYKNYENVPSSGELVDKRLDRRGVSFCTRTTYDDNSITNSVDIYQKSSGMHFMASNNDCGVREFDAERFQLVNHFRFPWPVNHTSMSPDCRLITVVGDHLDGLLVDAHNGKAVSSLVGHLDYSFATAWHPDGRTFATGNQDKTCRVWDMRHLKSPIAVLKGNLGAVRSIRFSSDGQFMVVAEPADFVHVYSTKMDYKKRQEIDFFGEISGISLSPDDESLYIGVWDRTYASLLHYGRRHSYSYLDSYL
ncbi:hypothetical protein Syun_005766 [Stephania yunnanensis]|uniref:Uncharacterized protein n=1 Tax=Stephania yunnanensis TaxID=152371 RepID=A0AAP0KWE3_9MAGN